MSKLKTLREKHPVFIYENFDIKVSKRKIHIVFHFKLEPDIFFRPKVVFDLGKYHQGKLDYNVLSNLVFHVGLMEIPSYWKAACSPEIIIKAGYLNKLQKDWWKHLIIRGLGEFFYHNRIDFTQKDFLTLHVQSKNNQGLSKYVNKLDEERNLVLIGGGKDSAVTMSIFKKNKNKFGVFLLNPTQAAMKISDQSGVGNIYYVKRSIDNKLLYLNNKGYFNGHTPFSAYLAFISTLASVVFNYGNIVVSNERSSNEANTQYKDIQINHQYSKTFEFERLFYDYVREYLVKNINYMSFLRPLYELQIAKVFSKYYLRYSNFKSCNIGKGEYWCKSCPKCLFVYISLYPFFNKSDLEDIFGSDLFKNKKLITILRQLVGIDPIKPFECVGTREESKIALYLSINKHNKEKKDLPFLLQYARSTILSREKNLEKRANKLMHAWDKNNNLSDELEKMLQKEIY